MLLKLDFNDLISEIIFKYQINQNTANNPIIKMALGLLETLKTEVRIETAYDHLSKYIDIIEENRQDNIEDNQTTTTIDEDNSAKPLSVSSLVDELNSILQNRLFSVSAIANAYLLSSQIDKESNYLTLRQKFQQAIKELIDKHSQIDPTNKINPILITLEKKINTNLSKIQKDLKEICLEACAKLGSDISNTRTQAFLEEIKTLQNAPNELNFFELKALCEIESEESEFVANTNKKVLEIKQKLANAIGNNLDHIKTALHEAYAVATKSFDLTSPIQQQFLEDLSTYTTNKNKMELFSTTNLNEFINKSTQLEDSTGKLPKAINIVSQISDKNIKTIQELCKIAYENLDKIFPQTLRTNEQTTLLNKLKEIQDTGNFNYEDIKNLFVLRNQIYKNYLDKLREKRNNNFVEQKKGKSNEHDNTEEDAKNYEMITNVLSPIRLGFENIFTDFNNSNDDIYKLFITNQSENQRDFVLGLETFLNILNSDNASIDETNDLNILEIAKFISSFKEVDAETQQVLSFLEKLLDKNSKDLLSELEQINKFIDRIKRSQNTTSRNTQVLIDKQVLDKVNMLVINCKKLSNEQQICSEINKVISEISKLPSSNNLDSSSPNSKIINYLKNIITTIDLTEAVDELRNIKQFAKNKFTQSSKFNETNDQSQKDNTTFNSVPTPRQQRLLDALQTTLNTPEFSTSNIIKQKVQHLEEEKKRLSNQVAEPQSSGHSLFNFLRYAPTKKTTTDSNPYQQDIANKNDQIQKLTRQNESLQTIVSKHNATIRQLNSKLESNRSQYSGYSIQSRATTFSTSSNIFSSKSIDIFPYALQAFNIKMANQCQTNNDSKILIGSDEHNQILNLIVQSGDPGQANKIYLAFDKMFKAVKNAPLCFTILELGNLLQSYANVGESGKKIRDDLRTLIGLILLDPVNAAKIIEEANQSNDLSLKGKLVNISLPTNTNQAFTAITSQEDLSHIIEFYNDAYPGNDKHHGKVWLQGQRLNDQLSKAIKLVQVSHLKL